MKIITMKYENNTLVLLDQTLLPAQSVYLELKTVQGVYDAIYKMQVRGAPAIGICAAYGLVIAAKAAPKADYGMFMESFLKDADYLASSRPTAVNLFWAIERMKNVALSGKGQPVSEVVNALENEASSIEDEDAATNRKIGENLLSLLHDGDTVLTHCNAGILATSRYGTALSPFYLAKEKGMDIKVYADETRPFLQGSRLTAYELYESGIDVTVICDNMAAMVMSKGYIDAIIVGCDRVARNGDTANKIGTLNLSILAQYFKIPLYIAAPTSTIDMNCPTGKDIPIEERDRLEVICRDGIWTAPKDVKVFNPAFDVTPAENITAIVTEKGIAYPDYAESFEMFFNAE
jgi:methylthioribose-1-phosphate isomerase